MIAVSAEYRGRPTERSAVDDHFVLPYLDVDTKFFQLLPHRVRAVTFLDPQTTGSDEPRAAAQCRYSEQYRPQIGTICDIDRIDSVFNILIKNFIYTVALQGILHQAVDLDR